ncbi:hypothetical protein AAMO2058_000052300 [Amorphochlora amoebiformis]
MLNLIGLRTLSRGLYAPRHMGPIVQKRMFSSQDEIIMLEKLLEEAKNRKNTVPEEPPSSYNGPSFNVQTYNAISPVGLQKFPEGKYKISADEKDLDGGPHAILLRSHKLQVEEVPATVRAIARCGAGTNNIPVSKMSELGIPVFNTPGANANAVKELVVTALLLSSRGISEGIQHVKSHIIPEENGDYDKISSRIEKDKKLFVGQEIQGKTLGVIGLGHIGSRVVGAALSLGMKVVGFDPALSLEAAWRLPGDQMSRASSLEDLYKSADYISLHVPYIKDKTHHLINEEALKIMKPTASICNFARGEIVDGGALRAAYESGGFKGKYISDFADKELMGHPNHIVMPHLGASTAEAEENSASMAADQIIDFLQTGSIRNSVNFPDCNLQPKDNESSRLCIVNENSPGVLGAITSFLGVKGINIEQQINLSRGGIAYTVIDMKGQPEDPSLMQTELAKVDGILSSRFIGVPFKNELGRPGTFYHVTWFQE